MQNKLNLVNQRPILYSVDASIDINSQVRIEALSPSKINNEWKTLIYNLLISK